MDAQPTYGYTDSGRPVHAQTHHYLPAVLRLSPRMLREDLRRADSFNAKFALVLTRSVGTMWCFYVFNGVAFVSLPSVISQGSLQPLIAWVSSNWIQLVLLPALMVGQNLQSAAADARAEKTFADVESLLSKHDRTWQGVEEALDRLDTHTEGGLKDVLDQIERLRAHPSAISVRPSPPEASDAPGR